MNVLVTGSNGFLGRHVCRLLREQGHNVATIRSKDVDLRKAGEVRAMMASLLPDVVIHLAATVGGIGANQAAPATFFYDNMAMGLNVIHESYIFDAKVVLVGTVCSYPAFTPVPFSEADIWNGYPEPTNAPYGVAKKALGVMLDAYYRQYGMKGAYLIPANLYGPEDNFDPQTSHVIPALVRKFVESADQPSVTIWGDGTPTREFLYVEDAAEAIVKAAFNIDKPEPINLGSGESVSMMDLAKTIANLVGFDGVIVTDTAKPNGQQKRAIDSARALKLLDWSAKTKLIVGLARTVEYYRKTLAHEKSANNGDNRTGR